MMALWSSVGVIFLGTVFCAAKEDEGKWPQRLGAFLVGVGTILLGASLGVVMEGA